MDPTGPEALAYVVARLPPEFKGVSFVYQWSNRAGFDGWKIRVHLWFWLTEPRADEELRRWARWWNRTVGMELVDFQLFKAVQPHYTADPMLPEGVVAPLAGTRTGMILGARDAVELRTPDRGGGSMPRGEGADLQPIARDDTGKAVDGREGLQVVIRLEVILDEGCPDEEDAFHAEVWRRLNERAVPRATATNPKEWTFEEARSKGRADWDNRDELRRRFGKRTRKRVPGVEPYWKSDPRELHEVTAEIGGEVDAWIDAPHDLMLRVTGSSGKTHAACRRVAERFRPGEVVDAFVPTHKLAAEVVQHFREGNPALEVVEVEGRNEKNCKRYELTREVGKAGLPVQAVCCDGGSRDEDGEAETAGVVQGDRTKRCPHFDPCPYQAQRRRKADVYVNQHAHLTQPRPKGWAEATRATVDEGCHKELVRTSEVAFADLAREAAAWGEASAEELREHQEAQLAGEARKLLVYREGGGIARHAQRVEETEVELRELDALIREGKGNARVRKERVKARDRTRSLLELRGSDDMAKRIESREPAALKLAMKLKARGVTAEADDETLADAYRVAKNELPLFDRVGRALRDAVEKRPDAIPQAVAEAGITPEMVEADATAELARWKKANILRVNPAMTDARILAGVGRMKGIPGRYYALRELAKAMRGGREVDNLAFAVVGPHKALRARWAAGTWRVRDLPTLFLDATGNPLIAGAVKPGTRFRKIDARQNVHVTQVVDRTLSKWSLLDAPDAERTRATVQTAILEFARGSSTGLLVTYKAAVGHFEVPAGWVKAHFGSPMRGVDEWKDFEAVAVLGCWTPRPDVVENQGAVLTMLTGGSMSGTGQEARELRDIHMADGSGVGVQVRTHPDPMAAAVGLSRDWGCESGRRYSRAGFPR